MPTDYEKMRHLDIGCGDGVTIRMIKPEGEMMGIDINEEMIKHARQKGITAHIANAEDLSMFGDETFDLVTCLDALEHLQHPTLAELYGKEVRVEVEKAQGELWIKLKAKPNIG